MKNDFERAERKYWIAIPLGCFGGAFALPIGTAVPLVGIGKIFGAGSISLYDAFSAGIILFL